MNKLKGIFSNFFSASATTTSKVPVSSSKKVVLNQIQTEALLGKIEEHATVGRFRRLDEKLMDACEIAHYALVNQEPVSIDHIKTIYPGFDLSASQTISTGKKDSKTGYYYEEGGIPIEDPFGMKMENQRGRTDQSHWKLFKERSPFQDEINKRK